MTTSDVNLPKIILINILLFFNGVISYGQVKISGRIINETHKPLEFVVVGVKKDSTIFKTAFTDSLGNYNISNIPPDTYKLLFYFIGYKTEELKIKITKDTIINVDLDFKTQELNEVIVLGNNGILERKTDRFVYSVVNSEITKGNSVYEVLKQTPLIDVNDNHNTIALINKPQTAIYVNGRKSNLSQDALINLLKILNTTEEDVKKYKRRNTFDNGTKHYR